MDSLPVLKEFLFHVLPYVIASLTFALLYKLIPNTQVEWRAALLGGAIGGCLWMLNNIYSAIYLSRVIALEQFPSGDAIADAARMNTEIEAGVRLWPEQYFWVHRRFKTRPDGVPSPYG